MYLLNNLKIDINRPFTGPDGTKYPHLRPQEYRDKLGVVEVPDPVYPDPKKFIYTENPDGTLNVVERPLAEVQAAKLAHIRMQAQEMIYQKYPAWVQSNAALGVYPVVFTDTMKDNIAAVIAASNVAQDAIEIALTTDEVNLVEATWPL